MYRIWHRIIKPVLITEEGGEKTRVLSFDGYRCVYTQRHMRAKGQKHAYHLPAGIKLALSCTVANPLTDQATYQVITRNATESKYRQTGDDSKPPMQQSHAL